MATLTKFVSMVSTDLSWRDSVSRKLFSKASFWVTMAARQPGPMFCRGGSLQEERMQEIPDLPASSEWAGLQRGGSLDGGQSPERTEEGLEGGRREFIVSTLFCPTLAALTVSSTEAAAAEGEIVSNCNCSVSLNVLF